MKGIDYIMNNYYEFTKLEEDGLTIDIYSALSKERLKNILDASFNDIENYLNDFANTFKSVFKGKDYDEYYYHAKALIEELNDIKIILNILAERNIND